MLQGLSQIRRDIELAEAFERVVIRLDETDFDRLTDKQVRQEIKRIQNQARKAFKKRIGF